MIRPMELYKSSTIPQWLMVERGSLMENALYKFITITITIWEISTFNKITDNSYLTIPILRRFLLKLDKRGRFSCFIASSKHEGELGEFETVMQIQDAVEGLHNCREFSNSPSCPPLKQLYLLCFFIFKEIAIILTCECTPWILVHINSVKASWESTVRCELSSFRMFFPVSRERSWRSLRFSDFSSHSTRDEVSLLSTSQSSAQLYQKNSLKYFMH